MKGSEWKGHERKRKLSIESNHKECPGRRYSRNVVNKLVKLRM